MNNDISSTRSRNIERRCQHTGSNNGVLYSPQKSTSDFGISRASAVADVSAHVALLNVSGVNAVQYDIYGDVSIRSLCKNRQVKSRSKLKDDFQNRTSG
jgi:hypothetical protein